MATNNFNYYIKLYKNIPTEPFNKTELINRKQKFLLMLKSYMKDILNTTLEGIKHLNNDNISQQYIKFINSL